MENIVSSHSLPRPCSRPTEYESLGTYSSICHSFLRIRITSILHVRCRNSQRSPSTHRAYPRPTEPESPGPGGLYVSHCPRLSREGDRHLLDNYININQKRTRRHVGTWLSLRNPGRLPGRVSFEQSPTGEQELIRNGGGAAGRTQVFQVYRAQKMCQSSRSL